MGDAQSSRTCSLAPDSPPIFQKTDGAYSSLNSSLSSVKLEHQARHYAANSESDTSIITLPEGFEVIYVLGSGVCRSLRALTTVRVVVPPNTVDLGKLTKKQRY